MSEYTRGPEIETDSGSRTRGFRSGPRPPTDPGPSSALDHPDLWTPVPEAQKMRLRSNLSPGVSRLGLGVALNRPGPRRFIALVLVALALVACSSDADVASRNLSMSAEQFEIERRVWIADRERRD